MTTKVKLKNVKLVSSFIGVEVSGLIVQNDNGTFVLIDESQLDLEVASGSEQGCWELLKAICERGIKQVILSKDGEEIILKAAEEVFIAA